MQVIATQGRGRRPSWRGSPRRRSSCSRRTAPADQDGRRTCRCGGCGAAPAAPFTGEAQRGEFYAFQLGRLRGPAGSGRRRASTFGGLTRQGRRRASPASAFTCINLGGVDSAARPFTRARRVSKGQVQAAVVRRAGARGCAGRRLRRASATVSAQGTARGQYARARFACRRRSSRLTETTSRGGCRGCAGSTPRWPSTTSSCKPYTPVTVTGRTVGVLGRTVTLNALGFPEQIESRFAIEMTHLADQAAHGADRPGGARRVRARDAAVDAVEGRAASRSRSRRPARRRGRRRRRAAR